MGRPVGCPSSSAHLPPGCPIPLLILTFVLGMKHGVDTENRVTVDGLTR
ncbi:MAG TPA: hypothetical protein PK225_02725 [Azonexus sp.]|nr:hypothetical protein [Azonexus sp.]